MARFIAKSLMKQSQWTCRMTCFLLFRRLGGPVFMRNTERWHGFCVLSVSRCMWDMPVK